MIHVNSDLSIVEETPKVQKHEVELNYSKFRSQN